MQCVPALSARRTELTNCAQEDMKADEALNNTNMMKENVEPAVLQTRADDEIRNS